MIMLFYSPTDDHLMGTLCYVLKIVYSGSIYRHLVRTTCTNMQVTQYIDTALAHGGELTVVEFVKYVNYPINTFMLERFWDTLGSNGLPIYVDDDLIKRFGYSSADIAGRKRAFTALLSTFVEGKDYFKYTNDEYAEYLEVVCARAHTNSYPEVDRSQGKNLTIHYLLTPRCLRETMMMGESKRAHALANPTSRLAGRRSPRCVAADSRCSPPCFTTYGDP